MSDAPKSSRKLSPNERAVAEYARTDHIVSPEAGTTLDEMLAPEYWAHVAKAMRPFDRIDVRPADGSWFAELLVRVVEPFSVRVALLQHVEFDRAASPAAVEVKVPEGYELVHRGRAGWSVKRLADAQFIKEGERDRATAAAWLDRHLKTLA
jgi:hypothetical protein